MDWEGLGFERGWVGAEPKGGAEQPRSEKVEGLAGVGSHDITTQIAPFKTYTTCFSLYKRLRDV